MRSKKPIDSPEHLFDEALEDAGFGDRAFLGLYQIEKVIGYSETTVRQRGAL